MGFKPIFEEERQFFKEKTGIELPTDCWRSGSKIYLDYTQEKPYLQFKVENKQIVITKDNRNGYKKNNKMYELPEQIKLQELIDSNKDNIKRKYDISVKNIIDIILKYPNHFYIVSHSGGKDSDLTYEAWNEALDFIKENHVDIFNNLDWVINFANTSNDTADTYKKIKKLPKEKLNILNPKMGWRKWIVEVKNYFIPSVMVRNCCAEYKEGQISKEYDQNRETISVIGVRSSESSKRSEYEMIMDYDWRINHFNSNTIPVKWINFAPIIDWKDEEVWLYLLMKDIDFNRQYRLGFNRCGCLICPYQSDYVDLITEKYYPLQWKWWEETLRKNYDIWHVKDRLKWTFEEWKNGKWKAGTSKIQELIQSSPTPEKIKEVAELQSISENMAAKYFNKKCKCGKSMNPMEIAMYYKTFGRHEDIQDDNRKLLCKKCFCEEMGMKQKEYTKKAIAFKDGGCNLF
jgi:phosphoadenosine phosphosulfate reductase